MILLVKFSCAIVPLVDHKQENNIAIWCQWLGAYKFCVSSNTLTGTSRHTGDYVKLVFMCNKAGKRLIVRTLCAALLVIYVTSSFISMTPFDPGGNNKDAIEVLLAPNICYISDQVVILVHSHAANFVC